MADLLEAFEALSYFGAFWLFVANSRYRTRCMDTWRQSSGRERLFHGIEASICTVCGLGPLALLYYLFAT